MHSLKNTNWLMAYIIMPTASGVALPIFVSVCFMTIVQAYTSRDFCSALRDWGARSERVVALSMGIFCLANTVAYIACTTIFRRDSDVATTLTSGKVFDCTWPCVALRIVWSAALGSVVITAWKLIHVRYMQRARTRRRVQLGMLLLSLICLGLLSLFAAEAWISWPFAMPVEALVTGSALWAYTLVPTSIVASFHASWTMLLRHAQPRARMLSDFHDMKGIISGVSGIGTVWLMFVLRHSSNMDGEEYEAPSRSLRSNLFCGESLVVGYWGTTIVVWCWNYHRDQAQYHLHQCFAIVRTGLLWLPAATWPLLLGSGSERSDDFLDIWLSKKWLCCPTSR